MIEECNFKTPNGDCYIQNRESIPPFEKCNGEDKCILYQTYVNSLSTVEKVYEPLPTPTSERLIKNRRIDINEAFNDSDSIENSQRIYNIGTGKVKRNDDE